MLLETAITIISFGIHDLNFDHYPITSDVYKVVTVTSMPVKNESSKIGSVGSLTIPTSFINKAIPSMPKWDMVLQAVAPVSNVHLAFERAGINRSEGDHLLNLAKGILAEMKYSDVKATPSLVTDPEENATYLTICLHVNATFEESLALDSKLTRELVYRTDKIPENLSFAVYDIG